MLLRNLFKNVAWKHHLILLILIFLVLLTLTPLKILSLIGVTLVGAGLLKVKLDYFSKLILFFVLLYAVNTLVAGLCFIFGVPFLFTPVILLYIVALAYWNLKRPLIYPSVTLKSCLKLTLKALLSAGAFLLLVAPVFSQKDYAAYTIFSFSSDNISHIELLKAVGSNEGYFYKPFSESKNVITEGLSGYPQGLHINMYFLQESLKPFINISSNYEIIVFTYAYSALIFIIFAWLFLMATKNFAKTSFRQSTPGLVAISFLFTGIFFGLFALGSQSQIACMSLFLAMLAFFKFASTTDNRHLYACFGIILLGSIAFTWLVLLPVAGLVALFCLNHLYLKPYGMHVRKYLSPLICSIFVGFISLTQIYVQVSYGSPKSDGINEPGFSITPSLYLISILVILAVLVLSCFYKQFKFWITPLIVSACFSFLVYLFQLETVGEARYYLYKSLYVVIALAVIGICLGFGRLIENYTSNSSKQKQLGVILCIVGIAIMAALYNINDPKNYITQRHGGGFSRELSATAISRINENSDEGRSIIAVGSCNRGNDYIATRLVGALTENNNSRRQALLSSMLLPKKEALLQAIVKYQKEDTKDIVIISSDYQLQTYLQQRLNNIPGKEEFVDIDFGHIPKNPITCPNLVK